LPKPGSIHSSAGSVDNPELCRTKNS
jgi:hypothetical protein